MADQTYLSSEEDEPGLTGPGINRRCPAFTRRLPLSPTSKFTQKCVYVGIQFLRTMSMRKLEPEGM